MSDDWAITLTRAFSLWTRRVDFRGGDQLGGDGIEFARAGNAGGGEAVKYLLIDARMVYARPHPPVGATQLTFGGARPPRALFGAPRAEHSRRGQSLDGGAISSARVSREARLTAPRRARSPFQLNRSSPSKDFAEPIRVLNP